jgi:hypothetical protein
MMRTKKTIAPRSDAATTIDRSELAWRATMTMKKNDLALARAETTRTKKKMLRVHVLAEAKTTTTRKLRPLDHRLDDTPTRTNDRHAHGRQATRTKTRRKHRDLGERPSANSTTRTTMASRFRVASQAGDIPVRAAVTREPSPARAV